MKAPTLSRQAAPVTFTPPGRALFEWAVLFAAVALLFPEAALIGALLAAQSRRLGYPRWSSALGVALWCGFLGLILRGVLGFGMFP
jgi:hypothetical protein